MWHTGVTDNLGRAGDEALQVVLQSVRKLCSAWIEKAKIGMKLIVVHIPSYKRMAGVYAELASLLSKIPPEDDYAIIGDFNGRIGRLDVKDDDFNGLVGNQLEHEESNENGTFLLNLVLQFKLKIANTFARSRSVRKTWGNNTTTSQIDHILVPVGSRIQAKRNSLKAINATCFHSDHKIVKAFLHKEKYAAAVGLAKSKQLEAKN